MSYSDNDLTDFTFNVTPLPLREYPQDENFTEEMFFFDITCTSLMVPPHVMSQNDDEDQSWIYNADSETTEHAFSVERSRLLDEPEEVSKATLVGLLSSNGINQVEGFMVERILRVVRDMEREYSYLGRKVLHIQVHNIGFAPQEEDNDNVEEDGDNGVGESLEKVRVLVVEGEGEERECAICLEKFVVGLEAMELPCLHVYHCGCIVKWLERRSDCPLCRKRLASPR